MWDLDGFWSLVDHLICWLVHFSLDVLFLRKYANKTERRQFNSHQDHQWNSIHFPLAYFFFKNSYCARCWAISSQKPITEEFYLAEDLPPTFRLVALMYPSLPADQQSWSTAADHAHDEGNCRKIVFNANLRYECYRWLIVIAGSRCCSCVILLDRLCCLLTVKTRL